MPGRHPCLRGSLVAAIVAHGRHESFNRPVPPIWFHDRRFSRRSPTPTRFLMSHADKTADMREQRMVNGEVVPVGDDEDDDSEDTDE